MAANMWKNSLKNVESDNNKILYETLLEFFLQRNGTYCLNKPRNSHLHFYVSRLLRPKLDLVCTLHLPRVLRSVC